MNEDLDFRKDFLYLFVSAYKGVTSTIDAYIFEENLYKK